MKLPHFPFPALLVLAAVVIHTDAALAQTVDFSRAEGVATGFLASLRGVFATAFFGIAFVVTGFLAAFNRISWAWVALVVVGAFLVFAGPAIVANLRAAFS